jgi:hypothetical protein
MHGSLLWSEWVRFYLMEVHLILMSNSACIPVLVSAGYIRLVRMIIFAL